MKVEESEIYRKVLKRWEVPSSITEEQAWAALESRISKTSERTMPSYRRLYVGLSAAAVVALAVWFLNPFAGDQRVQIITAEAMGQTVVLPDQSVVHLNSGSELSFDKNWGENRTVKFNGQAFFEVTKGSRFVVETGRGHVEVLGTSFDVFSREEGFRVACHTGIVRVVCGEDEMEISPGEKAILSEVGLAKDVFSPADPIWVQGEFSFDEAPLSDVFAELERQFAVTVTTENIGERLYTGGFTNSDLEAALQSICLPMGLSFEVKNGTKVLISPKEMKSIR
jgi:transmembrane sensor